MYGLPQAGFLAQLQLVAHLRLHGYQQTATPCHFRHISNGVAFTLVVDDFLVKYPDKPPDHLHRTLSMLYGMKIDWIASKYIGFTLHFDAPRRTVTLSMPGYIEKVLTRFVPDLSQGAETPALYVPPIYGAKVHSPHTDTSPLLISPAEKNRIQAIVGSLLFNARGVDPTILPAVNMVASLQAKPTQYVAAAALRLLQYCARYPNNSITGAIFYIGNKNHPGIINGSILALSTIIPAVVASAAEAEYAALVLAAQEAVNLRNILHDLGYSQSPTNILCDNACAVGLATNTVKQCRSKSIDIG